MALTKGETAERLVGQVLIGVGDQEEERHEHGDVLRYLSYADAEFARRTQAVRKDTDVTLTAGTWAYDVDDDVTALISAVYDTAAGGRRRVLERVPQCLVQTGENWFSSQGLPSRFYEIGLANKGLQVGFDPTPGETGILVTLTCAWAPVSRDTAYAGTGTILQEDSDQPYTPPAYHQALVHRAMAECFAIDQNLNQAAYYLQRFDSAVEEYNKLAKTGTLMQMRNFRRTIRGR